LERFDLVVLGHVLNELDASTRAHVVERAWQLAGGLLLIVEPGTPEGFAVVRAARDTLLASRAPSGWEYSKFAFAALARFPPTSPIWGRVIREPFHNKAYAEAKISSARGGALPRTEAPPRGFSAGQGSPVGRRAGPAAARADHFT
jgi:hypothetical protein